MEDKVLSIKELQGEGKWVIETVYIDDEGLEYVVWSDKYGEELYLD